MKWIPVSEKMPPKNAEVICSFIAGCGPDVSVFKFDGALWYTDECGDVSSAHCQVHAWMPMPPPYKHSAPDERGGGE